MDSKQLFAQQVETHLGTLCELLACPTGQRVPADVMGRCLIGTRMLAGTSSLMEYREWEELLNTYHGLLDTCQTLGHPWDERVAQVTSVVIELEESLAASGASAPGGTGQAEELAALITEVSALHEECAAAPAPAATGAAPGGPTDAVDLNVLGAIPEQGGVDLRDVGATPVEDEEVSEGSPPLAATIREVHACFRSLWAAFDSQAWRSRSWSSPELEDVRRGLGLLDYYAGSLDRLVRQSAEHAHTRCSIEPLRVTLCDFALETVTGTGRELDVEVNGVEQLIDPQMLPVAETVLQAMIKDAFERCEAEEVAIRIDVTERSGALFWRVSDDGNNFISDSRLDHEDQLAFYPGLKRAMRALADYKGVLSVEPGDGHGARFEFVLPVSLDPHSLRVFGNGGNSFAVHSSQLCDLLPAASETRGSDTYGDYIEIDRRRVPLIRLDHLYAKAPGEGQMIAVLGSIEKRVAIFVPDCGEEDHGVIAIDAISMWNGPKQPTALVGDKRMPLLDADAILEGYIAVTGTLGELEELCGGADEELQAGQPQASPNAPDEDASADDRSGGAEVLVVEQSRSMRKALASILKDQNVSTVFASSLEEAKNLIQTRDPRLIISEFRMPTMVAKELVDSLRDEGRVIPVLVTTSQSGKTADLLVEKLGVSGYLSKPLEAEEVASRVGGYLGSGVS